MKKSKNQEEKNLMKRWVFDYANAMIEEFNISRSEAFRRAHLARELVVLRIRLLAEIASSH